MKRTVSRVLPPVRTVMTWMCFLPRGTRKQRSPLTLVLQIVAELDAELERLP